MEWNLNEVSVRMDKTVPTVPPLRKELAAVSTVGLKNLVKVQKFEC